MRSSNPMIDISRLNLPLSSNATSIIRDDFGSKADPNHLTHSLFPSPLTCASIEDIAFMDEDTLNTVSLEKEHDYEEIGKLWIFSDSYILSGVLYVSLINVCNS